MSLTLVQAQAIALNRFGLGTRPDEAPPSDPKRWLIDQFDRFEIRPAAYAALPPPGTLARAYLTQVLQLVGAGRQAPVLPGAPAPAPIPYKAIAMEPLIRPIPGVTAAPTGRMPARARGLGIGQVNVLSPSTPEQKEALRIETRESYRAGVNARMASALATEAPFVERLAAFWSNHFALSVEKQQVSIFAAAYEVDAIRPHVLGRFEDMVVAAERHPAMLYYLDQFRSAGPNSVVAKRVAARRPDKPLGLNENLAREIMELHTLGVRTGYDQADVTEFARALTGWSIGGIGPLGGPDGPVPGGFAFRPDIHQPGGRTIMGKLYPGGGEDQARSVIRDLCASPATAKHIATKLARHFVADDPPKALVDRMARAFLDGKGNLPAVYRVMVEAPEAWAAPSAKFKTPWDWSVSALRGLGWRELRKIDAASMLTQLGQPMWKPGSPAGYDDIAASWAAPGALMRRVELAQRFVAQAGTQIDARALAPRLLGDVTPSTTASLAQAESGGTALALLLVSPEFQRR
jgi:uncharacterized protein (DUF1800 family)